MEIETLVSMIRHMRAQKAALDCMDEVLTVVMEAEQRVKAAEKAVTDYEAQLERLKETEDAHNREHAEKVAKLYEELAAKQVDVAERIKADEAVAVQRVERLEEAFQEKRRFHEAMSTDCTILSQKLRELSTQKKDLESDVELVKKQLRDIKESIR